MTATHLGPAGGVPAGPLRQRPIATRPGRRRDRPTAAPQGPRRLLFAPDLEVDEVAFALPFTFEHDDYVQALTNIATKLGPELGRQPA
ncbi:hypothetical protein FHX46_002290 [Amycolatopsis viridis]|uniref:LLM class flavin-dependent oxidoreductase n=1 Tax=Amycolatopsis viridis TaxID=185678 RepID=A0ABX0SWP0_9PSEU|nr:hypothetical protein [Amycolatopsis viridis]